ncbi:MAG: PAS domain S-box protein [Endomicrobiia bacterium]|nr:PAS domain S-box protein [Endomicrobiia bacterium]
MKSIADIASKLFTRSRPVVELRFEKIMDYLPDSLIIIDRRGLVTSVNRACRELLGYSREEIIGQSASMFFVRTQNDPLCSAPLDTKDSERYLGRILDELVASGFVNDLEVVFLTKDCRRIPMNFNGVVLRDARGDITGVLGLARDMRQTKKTIRKLDVLKNISLLSLEKITVEKTFERVSDIIKNFMLVERITFYLAEGDTLKSAHASDMAESITLKIGQGVAGYAARVKKSYYTNDASSDPRFFPEVDAASGYTTRRILAVPVIESARLFGVVEALDKKTDFTDEDVSDLEEIVNLAKFVVFDKIKGIKLERSEESYRELVESISDVIYTLDPEGLITYVSPAIRTLLGYAPADVVGRHYSKLLHPDDAAAVARAVEDCLGGKQYPIECRVKTADGGYRWVRTLGKIYHEDGKPAGVRATLSDITDRKAAEEDVRTRLAYEKMLADISAFAVVTSSVDDFFEETLALLGRNLRVSRAYICEHRRDTDTMDNTHEWCAEGVLPQKDTLQGVPASAIPWWMGKMKKNHIINYKNIEDIPSENERNILKAQDVKSILVFPVFVNSEYFGFLGFDDCLVYREWEPRDEDILKTVAQIISWVYERRRMEAARMKLHMQMLQSAKMASVGELAAGLAHEIGNPLQTILGNAELVLLGEKTEEVEAIKNAAIHAKKIIENLMDVSRQHEMKFAETDVNKLLEKTISLYGRQLELGGIKIVRHFSKLPGAVVSSSHLAQVFLNIITNARKAMPSGGALTITTTVCPDCCAVVSFKDTGVGIAPECMKRIFEPFFTTKKEGTGLGLAISYGIIKQHGGEISIHSDGTGKGVEVVIKVPVKGPCPGGGDLRHRPGALKKTAYLSGASDDSEARKEKR